MAMASAPSGRSPRPRRGRLLSILLLPLLLMALGEPAEEGDPSARPVPPKERTAPAAVEGAREEARLEGRVVDEVTGDGIPGAVVEIPELRRGGRCGKGGRFRVAAIPPRPLAYEVLIRAPGHRSKTVEIVFDPSVVVVETFSLRPLGH